MKKLIKKPINAIALFCLLLCLLPSGPAFSAEKTIGVIMTSNIPYYNSMHEAFIEQMKEEGLGPDKVKIILQRPAPAKQSWINAMRKLIAYDADIIVSYGAPATITAADETSDIPIIFAGIYDYKALALNNRNITGIISKVPITTLLKYLKKISAFKKLGVLCNNNDIDTVLQIKEVESLESLYDFNSVPFSISKGDDVYNISGIDALFITTCGNAVHCIADITGIAKKAKIPTASIIVTGEDSGVILSLTANAKEQGTEAAKLTAKVIHGEKASSIKVLSPNKIDLIINLKEAKKIGLKIPFDVISIATMVIN